MRFYARLRTRTWKRRADIVGIHNYGDANYETRRRTRGIIKEVRDHNRGANFWFTETGGLIGSGKNFPCEPKSAASLRRAEARAADAVDFVFELANTYRNAGVQRIYLYNWYGNDCASNDRIDPSGREPDELAGFDAGLVRADGRRGPGSRRSSRHSKGASSAEVPPTPPQGASSTSLTRGWRTVVNGLRPAYARTPGVAVTENTTTETPIASVLAA